MVTCALCGRSMLLGEKFDHWRKDGSGSEEPICRLCAPEAEKRGWARVDKPPERRTSLNPSWHARRVA